MSLLIESRSTSPWVAPAFYPCSRHNYLKLLTLDELSFFYFYFYF